MISRHVVKRAVIIGKPLIVPQAITRPFAQGTRELPGITARAPEPPMGDKWFYSMRLENLGRNFAIAGGLELAYRLGRAHRDFEELRR